MEGSHSERTEKAFCVPAAVMGLPSHHVCRWRGFAVRSAIMALVMLCHLVLLLFLLRPAVPWPWRRSFPAATDHPLLIDLLPVTPHAATLARKPPPNLYRRALPSRLHTEAQATLRLTTTASAVVPSQVSGHPSGPLSISTPFIPYGNHRFAHALDGAQSSGLPRLPGSNAGPISSLIHVRVPPSLKSRLSKAGKWLNCKNAIFKGRMTDEELLKRGLTHRQMNQAYTELGCPP